MSNFFLFGSAVPFGIFAVTIVSRLRFMGVRAAGTNIALLGGLIATIALILSGSVGWILSVPEVSASAQIVKAFNFLNFLMGGVVFAVGFGLLAAGVSVTCYFMRLLTRWLAVFGMFIAITGEALVLQPHRVSGKLFHSYYQVPGSHLDGRGRHSADEKSKGGGGLYWRVCIDCAHKSQGHYRDENLFRADVDAGRVSMHYRQQPDAAFAFFALFLAM